MRLAFQVFCMIGAFFIAVMAIGYFYHITTTPGSKIPLLPQFPTPTSEETVMPTPTTTPTLSPTPIKIVY